MRALFTASTPATPDFPPDTDTSSTSPPTLSVSSPYDPTPPRRIKSKSSLRSIRSIGSSSLHEDDYDEDPSDKTLIRPSILRRLSPGLAARVKLLDGSAKTANSSRSPGAVGRIPEEHIKELDSLHKKLSAKVEKKGRAWNGITLLNKSPKQQKQQPTLDVPEPEWVEDLELGSDHAVPLPDRREKQEEEVEETPTTMSVVESAPAPLGPEMGDSNAEDQAEAQTDFEKYIQTTSQIEANGAPPPPPKDSPPPPSSASSNNIPSFFNPLGLHRTDSIYSFSRSSFSNQISQLTSIILPQPSSLATGIASISNAPSAVKALTGAAEQIQIWIKKASDVLSGLDAEDDVEWAAAGGREGLDGVDKAITKFEGLVNVYVRAIEEVQVRDDIANVSTDSLETIVTQMDNIIRSWADIKSRLRSVKQQVELAMEWEELWNNVLGEVGIEINKLDRLVFEMEERRHSVGPDHDFSAGMDLNELETIVEETPSSGVMRSDKRSSIGSIYATAPALDTPVIQTPQDDTNISNLHELFARLQPLRASLDFLPMRLSMFQSRAERIFPSACEELVDRRDRLEKGYSALQTDAESLQKELVEDRWIMVFRNAGSQAQRMFESVERSILKLQEGLETGMHLHNPSGMSNRIESYEAKKQHYVPAIERVVVIIQKGLKDRLTINGEILRLLHGMTSKVDALKASIKVMDSSLEDVQHLRTQHMRDSISSIQTMDSPATGSVIGTPGSSPASSIVMTPANKSTAPLGSSARRGSSVGSAARTSMGRRFSGLPQPSSTKKSSIPKTTLTAPSAKPYGLSTPTPAIRKSSQPTLSPAMLNRPRWNGSTNTTDLDVGHTHKTLSPSLHKSLAPSRRARPSSTIPSPTHRDLSASPAPSTARSISRVASRLTSRSPRRTASPAPGRSLLDPPPYSKLNRPTGTENMSNAPRSRQSFAGLSFSRSVSQDQDRGLSSPTKATRPGTALGHSGSRRISLLPLPKNPGRKDNTPATRSKLADRPAWRG